MELVFSFQSSTLGKVKKSVRDRIINKAEELFFRYGIKSVTMDDIARELGISKKTIYLHFPDKDSILLVVVERHLDCDRQEAAQMHKLAIDPIAEMVWSSEMMKQQLVGINPTLLFDMKKYHPAAWAVFELHKRDFFLNIIRINLTKGVEMGLYRSDLNIEVIARLHLEEIELCFNPDVFPPRQFNIITTQLALLDHFIRGAVTSNGLDLYEKYRQKPPNITVQPLSYQTDSLSN